MDMGSEIVDSDIMNSFLTENSLDKSYQANLSQIVSSENTNTSPSAGKGRSFLSTISLSFSSALLCFALLCFSKSTCFCFPFPFSLSPSFFRQSNSFFFFLGLVVFCSMLSAKSRGIVLNSLRVHNSSGVQPKPNIFNFNPTVKGPQSEILDLHLMSAPKFLAWSKWVTALAGTM